MMLIRSCPYWSTDSSHHPFSILAQHQQVWARVRVLCLLNSRAGATPDQIAAGLPARSGKGLTGHDSNNHRVSCPYYRSELYMYAHRVSYVYPYCNNCLNFASSIHIGSVTHSVLVAASTLAHCVRERGTFRQHLKALLTFFFIEWCTDDSTLTLAPDSTQCTLRQLCRAYFSHIF